MTKVIFIWLCKLPFSLIVTLFSWVFSPLIAIGTVRKPRTDTVKRLNKQVVTLDRDYLLPVFRLFATFDNAADEWWYGMYNTEYWVKSVREWTQADYDGSWWIRYFCRLAWLIRNPAYGWGYYVFGVALSPYDVKREVLLGSEDSGKSWSVYTEFENTLCHTFTAFQYRAQWFYTSNRYIDINIGYKSHKGFNDLMYGNRFSPFRKK